MVEVFKTNVLTNEKAHSLVHIIHASFTGYKANFDLQDCDNILRIECCNGNVDASRVISLMARYHCSATILADMVPASYPVKNLL